jgi:hypothetical protein
MFTRVLSDVASRVVAIAVCVTVVAAGFPRAARRTADVVARGSRSASPAFASSRADSTARFTPPADTRFLRDAIPAVGFAAEPEDTTDDFFLPEEEDKKKLVRDIAAWVIACAFVAFFIVKVFIEEEEDPPPDDDGGKQTPPL